jgi:hypothetical protein
MSIRTILPIAAVTALALVPAAALANLEVHANGFHRVVVGSMQNGNCEVHRMDDGRIVRCPDGSRGTLTLYQHALGEPMCQVDFWYDTSSGPRPWHITVSHQNSEGGCTTTWQNNTTLNVDLSSI